MNSIENMLAKVTNLLKNDNSLNTMLNNLGISKEEALKKLGNIKEEDISSLLSNKSVQEKLNQMSPEDIQKIKEMSHNPDNIQKLYNKYIDSKEDK